MSTPAFDESGNLTPYGIIEMRPERIGAHFVTAFPESGTRMVIFESHQQYLEQLRSTVGGGFTQWVNGRFLMQKLNPGILIL